MKRVVIAVKKPWEVIPQYPDHSIMIVDPSTPDRRYQYLLDRSDYSILHTDQGLVQRGGGDYPNERIVLYTSGTTGDSKFYGYSQSQLDHVCDTIIKSYQLTDQDRYFGIMPLWHAHGNGFYWATLRAGVHCAYGAPTDIKKMEQFQPTLITAVPRILKAILPLDLKHLRFIRSASAPLPDSLYCQLRAKFNVPVIEAFGMTEACSHCFTNPLLGPQRMGTVGQPSGIEAKIDADQHLWIRGPSVHLPNTWIDTGDLAEVDAEGYYSIQGRSVDQINVDGIKVNPHSLETQCLAEFPSIEQIVVYGIDRVRVQYVGSVPPDQVAAWFRSQGTHCRPELCESVEQILDNDLGKVSRAWLNLQRVK